MPKTSLIHIRTLNARACAGRLSLGHLTLPCLLGRSGITHRKREGDGATPVGTFRLQRLYYRSGSAGLPRFLFAARALRRDDGWCDDVKSFAYNRWLRLPQKVSHEDLWRSDHLYDVVIATSHNQRPRIRGAGSAIFFHLTGDKPFTQGCVAVSAKDMRKILGLCRRDARLVIWPPGGSAPRAFRKSPTPP